jgi:hypothetical protein
MNISKNILMGIISLGLIFSNSQKIAIGGITSSGITENELIILKKEIDSVIKNTTGFTLIESQAINKKLNQESPDLLDCSSVACSHEISHIFGLNAVISGEVIFHKNGVNIKVNIFSHWKEDIIAEINEEHAPIKFSAVTDLISSNYIPELLDTFSKLVKPRIQIIEPAKFYSIPENNKLKILLNLTDNRGLRNYTVKYSSNGGHSFKEVQHGDFNNELNLESLSISIPLTDGITEKGMVQVAVTDIDGNTRIKNSELFKVEDNTPPQISITSPKMSEIIKGSNDFNITWEGKDNLGVSSYSIYYSSDSGNSYNSMAVLNGTFKNFIWQVPDLLTNRCYLKIEAVDFTGLKSTDIIGPISVMDGASPTFTIMTNLKGASFPENTYIDVVLNLRDNTGVKAVEAYYTNDRTNYELLNQSVYDNLIKNKNASFNFKLPSGVTNTAQIKWVVKDLFENEQSIYTSNFNLTDNTPPNNNIVYPVAGVKFKGLGQGKVIWSATDNTIIVSHECYYSLDNGKAWQFIGKSGGDKNNIIWDIPNIHSKSSKIKIITKDAVGLSTETISDVFEINDVMSPKIEILKPTIFTDFKERDTVHFSIKVTDNIGIKNTQVYLKIGAQSQNLSYKPYAPETKSTIIEFSKVLNALPKDEISLVIMALDFAENQTDITSKGFNLKDNTPPTVSFSTQFSGEVIDGNTNFKLDWNTRDNAGINTISLNLTSDGGQNWDNLQTFYSKTEYFLWSVPNLHSENCKLKLIVTDINGFTTETITSNFSIRDITGPELTIISPKKYQSFKEYEIINVSTFAHDDYGLGLVELYYSIDGSKFEYVSNEAFTHDIVEDTVSFTFKIKAGMSDKAIFKFIGVDRFNNESESITAPFKVIDNTPPNVEFTLNLQKNEFGTGKAIHIDWVGSDNFNLKNTLLEYTADNGDTWIELYSKIIYGVDSKHKFTWLIPNKLKNSCKIRATMTDKMNLSSSVLFSDFKIVDETHPEITFKSQPAERAYETQFYKLDLILTDNYDVKSIDFYYAKDRQNFEYISSNSELSQSNSELSHELKIPKGFSKSAIIKLVLTDLAGNSSTKLTPAFEVIDFTNPEINFTSDFPNSLKNGEHIELTWNSSDNEAINSHLIEFSKNNGQHWVELAKIPGTQHNWEWNVPDLVLDNNALIRVIVIDHVQLTDSISTNPFTIIDKTNPELFIPLSKYHIEINENDTLYQSFQISDNVQIQSLKVEYSNIPRQFKVVSHLNFEMENISSKSLKVAIPIPPGATKNAKFKTTLTDKSGNSIEQLVKGIRVLDNTPPNVKFVEPFIENPENTAILVVGDTLWFQWESNDNTGIRSNRVSFKLDGTDYWKPILSTKGEDSSLSWTIPEKAVGLCEFQIITTDKVGLQAQDKIGPFQIKDILNETREDHLRKYGTINIESNPSGAMVMVDNIEKGYTPLKVKNLSAGNHRLVLFKRKFKHVSKVVQIQMDSVLTINEVLEEKK